MFYESYVYPYAVRVAAAWLIYGDVTWYRNGKQHHHGDRVYFGKVHDDDCIDTDKLLTDMIGKTIYDAACVFNNVNPSFSL